MGNWIRDVPPFIADMFRHTVGKLTGFLSIALGLAPVIYPKFFAGDQGVLHARSVWWVASAIAFFLASMAAWTEQHSTLLICQRELADRQPNFELSIANLNWEYNSERNETNYMLSAMLLNRGASSVAVGWKAIYRQNGREDEVMSGRYLTQPYVLTQPDGRVTLTNASLMQTKTLTNPLGCGDARTGRLLFTLPGDRTLTKDFKIEVSCFDFTRKECTALYMPEPGYTSGIRFFPDEAVTSRTAQQIEANSRIPPPPNLVDSP